MQLLLQIFFRYRFFLTFLLLEAISVWAIVRNNAYQSAYSFTSSNLLVAQLYSAKNYIDNYFSLRQVNEDLVKQNARLKEDLRRLEIDQLNDTAPLLPHYNYIAAKVINNSVFRNKNYLTINKGTKDGIAIGMGVVSGNGVIGKVKACSEDYATVTSLLNSDIQVASRIKKNNIICTTKWDMLDYRQADLLEIGRHVDLKVNDTIITSGFSQVYPESYPIGKVKSVNLNKSSSFLKAKIIFFTDFSSLSYVYVIKNKKQNQLDSLQGITITDK